ncbi:hypothetical protein GCM10009581_10570 [Tsukamurella strandjordii]
MPWVPSPCFECHNNKGCRRAPEPSPTDERTPARAAMSRSAPVSSFGVEEPDQKAPTGTVASTVITSRTSGEETS